jgi:hypothetical protein
MPLLLRFIGKKVPAQSGDLQQPCKYIVFSFIAMEQQVKVKFCFNLGKRATET